MNQVYYRLWAVRKTDTFKTVEGVGVLPIHSWHLYCSDDTSSDHTESTRVARFETLDRLMQYARAEWPDIDVQVQPNKEEEYE